MSTQAAPSLHSFEARYEHGQDPWSLASSPYELARYATTLAALRRSAYGTVYEPGCAVGVLTRQLAAIAQRVVAVDFAPSAVEQARQRCVDFANVEVRCADVRTFLPEQTLDLVIFSELGYYFAPDELGRIGASMAQRLAPGGEFVAVHWLGDSEEHVLHGDEVHEVLHDSLGLRALRSSWHEGFRLDSWMRQ